MKILFSYLSGIRVLHAVKRLLVIIASLVVICGLMLTLVFLGFTFYVLPNLDQYRPALERYLSESVGRPVQIRALSGHWAQLAPQFDLSGVFIANSQNGQPLTLQSLSIVPSWTSLLVWQPRLASLLIQGPAIELIRSDKNIIYLNGLPLNSGGASDNHLGNWLLQQSRLEVRDASLSWQDQLLGLPRLDVQRGQLLLTDGWFKHTLAVSGKPAASLGNKIELLASWRGNDVNQWQQWTGSLRVALNGARMGRLSAYLQQLGVLHRGEGSGTMELSFADGAIESLLVDVSVRDAAYTPPDARELVLPQFEGRVQLERQGAGHYQIKASKLRLASVTGLAFDNSAISGEWTSGAQGGGKLLLDKVNLNHLVPFIRALGVDRNPLFAKFAPSGSLDGLSVSWQGPVAAPKSFKVTTRFRQLAWQAVGELPGVAGVSGTISFDEQSGRLQLNNGVSQVSYPEIFAQPLSFDRLQADVSWQQQAGRLVLDFTTLKFANADLNGWLQGRYDYARQGSSKMDFTAGIDEIKAVKVPDYLPYQVGKETLSWLRKALLGGEAKQVTMHLSGDPMQFPFVGGKGGEFRVEAQLSKAVLRYDSEWPKLDDIEAQLLFHNERMEVKARSASTLGTPLTKVTAIIDHLGADEPLLTIDGRASDQLSRLLAFTTQSPVDGWLNGFTGRLRASGKAVLDLHLNIPLDGPKPASVRGDLQLNNNQLRFASYPTIPSLNQLQGSITFTEHGVNIPGLRLQALGGAGVMKASTAVDKRMHFNIVADANARQVFQQYLPRLAPHVDGRFGYRLQFVLQDGLQSLQLNSDLQGMSLGLPLPLNKPAVASLPLELHLREFNSREGTPELLEFKAGSLLAGKFSLSEQGEMLAGTLSVQAEPAPLPKSGLRLKLKLPSLVWSEWQHLLEQQSAQPMTENKTANWLPFQLELQTPKLVLPGLSLHQFFATLDKTTINAPWQAKLMSDEVQGQLSYLAGDKGLLQAHFQRVDLPLPLVKSGSSDQAASTASLPIETLPALKVEIDDFLLQGRSLGHVEMAARQDGPFWRVDPLRVTVPEATLNSSLKLSLQGKTAVEGQFELHTSNAGKLLARLGEKEVFRDGQGVLSGNLGWPGGLADFDLARLSGQVSLDFKNGRFTQVDSSAARLLSVLSLRAIPRRLRLDFSDIFTPGFAFDTFRGEAMLKQGVFSTDKLQIRSPVADIQIAGQVDLRREQQDLQVQIVPYMTDSVTVLTGAALLNPLAGLATFIVQRVLKNPIGRALSFNYRIKGPLLEPDVTNLPNAATRY
ncbi:YhdP family protein [Neisseriaceae bacterium TC5R-5]|nr:YhdP family protein [Neisseriaceae bacterium TC5R-5]